MPCRVFYHFNIFPDKTSLRIKASVWMQSICFYLFSLKFLVMDTCFTTTSMNLLKWLKSFEQINLHLIIPPTPIFSYAISVYIQLINKNRFRITFLSCSFSESSSPIIKDRSKSNSPISSTSRCSRSSSLCFKVDTIVSWFFRCELRESACERWWFCIPCNEQWNEQWIRIFIW